MPDGLTFHADTRVMRALAGATPHEANTFLRGLAQDMVNDVKLSMGTSPPGRTYNRGNRSHTASQPGYPPTPDTGTLRASMRWEQKAMLELWIMDGVEYGIDLEFGTHRIAPRPFIGPVFEAWRGDRLVERARQARLMQP